MGNLQFSSGLDRVIMLTGLKGCGKTQLLYALVLRKSPEKSFEQTRGAWGGAADDSLQICVVVAVPRPRACS